jgi:TP901 family phage tail tape measure protein
MAGKSALNLTLLNDVLDRLDKVYQAVIALDAQVDKLSKAEINIEVTEDSYRGAKAVNLLANSLTRLSKVTTDGDVAFGKLERFMQQLSRLNLRDSIGDIPAKDFSTLSKGISDISKAVSKFGDVASFDALADGIGRLLKSLRSSASDSTGTGNFDEFEKLSKTLKQLSLSMKHLSGSGVDPEKIKVLTSRIRSLIKLNQLTDAEKNVDFNRVRNILKGFIDIMKSMPDMSSGNVKSMSKFLASAIEVLSRLTKMLKDFAGENLIGDEEVRKRISALSRMLKSITEMFKGVNVNVAGIVKMNVIGVSLGMLVKSLSKIARDTKTQSIQGVASIVKGIGSLINTFSDLQRSKFPLLSLVKRLNTIRRIGKILGMVIKTLVRSAKGGNVDGIGSVVNGIADFTKSLSDIIPAIQRIGNSQNRKVIRRYRTFVNSFTKSIKPLLKLSKKIPKDGLQGLAQALQALQRLFEYARQSTGDVSFRDAGEDLAKGMKAILKAMPKKNDAKSLAAFMESLNKLGDNSRQINAAFTTIQKSDRGMGFKSNVVALNNFLEIMERVSNAARIFGRVLINSLTQRGFFTAINRLSKGLMEVGQQLRDIGERVRQMGTEMLQSVGIQRLFSSSAVTSAAEFEKTSTLLGVFGGLNEEARQQAEDFANELGRKYPISANQALEATLDLIKAGQTMSQVEFILPSAADLAALSDSGSIEGATTTLISAASAFRNFDDSTAGEFANISRASDILAAAADVSTASVESLSQGLANVGASADAFGLTFEETNAILAIFDQNAIKGAEGGTALRSLLNALSRPQTQQALRGLGISMFEVVDGVEQARSINDIINDINSSLSGMTASQRNNTLQQLADTFGRQGLNVLLGQGEDAIENVIEQMNGLPSASERAAQALDNFQGDVTQLKGSWETLLTAVFLPTLEDFFRPFVKIARLVVDGLLSLDRSVLRVVGNGIVFASLLATVIGSVLVLGGALAGLGSVFFTLGGILINFPLLAGGIFAGLSSMALGAIALVGALATIVPTLLAVSAGFTTFLDILRNNTGGARDALTNLSRTLHRTFKPFIDLIGSFFNLLSAVVFGSSSGQRGLEDVGGVIASFTRSVTRNLANNRFIQGLSQTASYLSGLFDTTARLLGFKDELENIEVAEDFNESRAASSINARRRTILRDRERMLRDFLETNRYFIRASGLTMEEAHAHLFDFFRAAIDYQEAFGNIFDNFFKNIGEEGLFSAIRIAASEIKPLVKEAVDDFFPIIKDFIKAVGPALYRSFQFMVRGIVELSLKPLELASYLLEKLGLNRVTQIIDGFISLIRGALDKFFEGIEILSRTKSLSITLGTLFPDMRKLGVYRFVKQLLGVTATIGSIFGRIFEIISGSEILGGGSDGEQPTFLKRVDNFFGGFANLLSRLQTLILDPFLNVLRTDYTQIPGMVADFVTSLFERLRQVVYDNKDAVGEIFVGILNMFMNPFRSGGRIAGVLGLEDLEESFETSAGFLSDIYLSIWDTISRITGGENLEDVFMDIFGVDVQPFVRLLQAIGSLLLAGYHVVQSVVLALVTNLPRLINSLVNFLRPIIDFILSTDFVELANQIANGIGGIISGAVTGLTFILDNYLTPALELFAAGDILGALNIGIVQPLRDLVSSLAQSVVDFFASGQALTLVTSIVSGIAATLGTIITTLINLIFTTVGATLGIDLTYAKDQIIGAIEDLLLTLQNFFLGDGEKEGVFSGLVTIIGNVAGAIGSFLSPIIDLFTQVNTIGEGGESSGEGGISILAVLLEQIVNFASRLAALAIEGVGNTLTAIQEIINYFANLDTESLKSVLAVLGGVGLAIGTPTLIGFFTALGTSLTVLLGAIKPFLVKFLPILSALLIVKNLLENIGGFLDSIDKLLRLDLGGALSSFIDAIFLTLVGVGLDVLSIFGLDMVEEELTLIGRRVGRLITGIFYGFGLQIRQFFDDMVYQARISIMELEARTDAQGGRGFFAVDDLFSSGEASFSSIVDLYNRAYAGEFDQNRVRAALQKNRGELFTIARDVLVDGTEQDMNAIGALLRSNDLLPRFVDDLFADGEFDLAANLFSVADNPEVVEELAGDFLENLQYGLIGADASDALFNAINWGALPEDKRIELQTAIQDAMSYQDYLVTGADIEVDTDTATVTTDGEDTIVVSGGSVDVNPDSINLSRGEDVEVIDTSGNPLDITVTDVMVTAEGYDFDLLSDVGDFDTDSLDSPQAIAATELDVAELRTKLGLLMQDFSLLPEASAPAMTVLNEFDNVLNNISSSLTNVAMGFVLGLPIISSAIFMHITLLANPAFRQLIMLIDKLSARMLLFPVTAGIFNIAANSIGSSMRNIQIAAYNAMTEVLKLISALESVPTDGNPLTTRGERAIGGTTMPKGLYEVAERGSELFYENGRAYLLSSGYGKVETLDKALPRFDFASSFSGMTPAPATAPVYNTTTYQNNVDQGGIHITVNGSADSNVVRQIRDEVQEQLKKQARNSKRTLRGT